MTHDQAACAAVTGTWAPFPTVATVASVALIAALLLTACGAEKAAPGATGKPGTPGGGMPPPPPVGVLTVAPQTVALQTELPGRVEAQRTAQVRARVTGVVLQRQFREGSEARAGAPLFLIDPLPYQAALDSALAQQARAKARWARPGPPPNALSRWPKHKPSAARTMRTPKLRSWRQMPTWPPPRPRCRRPASAWATRA